MRRQRQLDGVRGVAILMVMMLHSLLLPVGWMGVDLFFVLSGFLITRILRESRSEENYWKSFYIKRAGRILPPLVLLFVVVLTLSRKANAVGILGYALFLGDYLNTSVYQVALLVPLWSLAIEEHFYIVWPFAVRSCSRMCLVQIVAAVLAIEPMARFIFTPIVADPKMIRFFTPFRLDAIAAGSLLALVMEHRGSVDVLKRINPKLLASAIILYAVLRWKLGLAFTPSSPVFNGIGYSLVAVICFAVVAHLVMHEQGRCARWLSWAPLVFLGEISYGLYLFHGIVRGAIKSFFGIGYGPGTETLDRLLFMPTVLVSLLACALLYRFYETPIIRLSKQKANDLRDRAEIVAICPL